MHTLLYIIYSKDEANETVPKLCGRVELPY